MKIKCIPIAYLLLLLLHGCSHSKKIQAVITQNPPDTLTHNKMIETDPAKTDSFFVGLLQQYPQYFEAILKNRKDWNVQIIYTEINRDKNNNPKFRDYYFNVDASKYFYPASTVKLPVALLALQKLHELRNTGITRSTSMITEAAYSGQVATYNDPQTPDGRPTLESYIKRIFLVSDNEAFNRIYEFLGQQYINEQLHKRGYTDAQIIHRLDVFLSEDENRHTNPVKFLDNNNKILYSQPLVFNEVPYPERHDSLGKAYYSEGKLINMPMNFSKKNRLSLEDLHQILRSVIFPNALPENQRFDLTDGDYAFLHQYMSPVSGGNDLSIL